MPVMRSEPIREVTLDGGSDVTDNLVVVEFDENADPPDISRDRYAGDLRDYQTGAKHPLLVIGVRGDYEKQADTERMCQP